MCSFCFSKAGTEDPYCVLEPSKKPMTHYDTDVPVSAGFKRAYKGTPFPETDEDIGGSRLAELVNAMEDDDIRQNIRLMKAILLDNINKRMRYCMKRVTEISAQSLNSSRRVSELEQRMAEAERRISRSEGMANSTYAFMRESQRRGRVVSWDDRRRQFV